MALTSQQTFPSEPPSPTGFTVEGAQTTRGTHDCDVVGGVVFSNFEFSAQSDGTVSGTYTLSTVNGIVRDGVLFDGTTDGSTYSLTGEGLSICAPLTVGEVTISGDCGDDVTITYDDPTGQTIPGTLIGNVECTLL